MITIRDSMFETNSSNMHNMIMCDDETYNAFVNGDVLWYDLWYDSSQLVNTSEAYNDYLSYMKEGQFDQYIVELDKFKEHTKSYDYDNSHSPSKNDSDEIKQKKYVHVFMNDYGYGSYNSFHSYEYETIDQTAVIHCTKVHAIGYHGGR